VLRLAHSSAQAWQFRILLQRSLVVASLALIAVKVFANIAEVWMPRYFFHLGNWDFYRDEVGRRFSDPEDAKAHAVVVARELGQDSDWEGYAVVVIDEHGDEIARVQIKTWAH
jgi:hypothetical protein